MDVTKLFYQKKYNFLKNKAIGTGKRAKGRQKKSLTKWKTRCPLFTRCLQMYYAFIFLFHKWL